MRKMTMKIEMKTMFADVNNYGLFRCMNVYLGGFLSQI